MRKIAVLTSGGDAPGMNAAIRAVTRYAIYKGLEVYGVERGYTGLINSEIKQMDRRAVSDIIQRGGTILKTSRSPEFNEVEYQKMAAENLEAYDIGGLVVIGGDGSFRGAKDLTDNCGIKTVGIPGTIDNDLAYTDYTLGFDTAVNTALSAINNLRDTMTSHERVCIVEVMGRKCGDIALYAGLGGGAEVIIVPEVHNDITQIAKSIAVNKRKGKTSDIIVLAEGVCRAVELKQQLKDHGITSSIKTTELGYIQRGGAPTMQDRLLAAQFGVRAVDVLLEGKGFTAEERKYPIAPSELDKSDKILVPVYDLNGVVVGYKEIASVPKPNGDNVQGGVSDVVLDVKGTAGAAITNATVTVTSPSGVTVTNNGDGTYSFSVAQYSAATVSVAASGYTTQTVNITKANTKKNIVTQTVNLVAAG